MTDRLHVDPGSLEGIADQLRRSGDALGATSSGSPGAPDAGIDTPIFDELLARHTQDAGKLADGIGQAATTVVQANQTYAAEDQGNAQNITGSR